MNAAIMEEAGRKFASKNTSNWKVSGCDLGLHKVNKDI